MTVVELRNLVIFCRDERAALKRAYDKVTNNAFKKHYLESIDEMKSTEAKALAILQRVLVTEEERKSLNRLMQTVEGEWR